MSGAIVAYEQFESANLVEYFRTAHEIVVRDLRTGSVLHRLPTGTGNSPTERKHRDVGIGDATALVVKSDGAVAWIVAVATEAAVARDRAEHREISEYQVHVVDATGSQTLAEGTNIGPDSLTLNGSTLHWTQAGKAMAAPLA